LVIEAFHNYEENAARIATGGCLAGGAFGGRIKDMPEWLAVVLFIAGYWVVIKWVLPKLGIASCMSGKCDVERRRKAE
jgi:hypothetical protein